MRAVRALVWLAVSAHCLPQLDPPVGLSVDEAGESSSPGGVAVMIEPRHIPERALVLSNAVEVLSSTRPEGFWSIVLLHGGGDVTDVTGNSALRAVRAQLLPEGGLRLLARNPNSSLWYNDFLKTPELWSLFEQKHLLLFESDSAFCANPTVPIADFVSGTLAGRPLYGAPWPVGGWGEMGGCVGNSGFSLWDRTAMLNVTQRARDENGGVSPIGTAIDRWASSQFRRTGRTPLCGQTPPNAEESLRYAQTANMFSVPPQRLEPACLLHPLVALWSSTPRVYATCNPPRAGGDRVSWPEQLDRVRAGWRAQDVALQQPGCGRRADPSRLSRDWGAHGIGRRLWPAPQP